LRRPTGLRVDASAAVGALEVGITIGVISASELALTPGTVAAGRAFLVLRADPVTHAPTVAARLVDGAIVAGLARRRVLSVLGIIARVVGIGSGPSIARFRVWGRLVGIVFGRRNTGAAPADAVAGAVGIVLTSEGTPAVEAEGIAAAVGVLRAGDPTDVVLAASAVSTLGIPGAFAADDTSALDAGFARRAFEVHGAQRLTGSIRGALRVRAAVRIGLAESVLPVVGHAETTPTTALIRIALRVVATYAAAGPLDADFGFGAHVATGAGHIAAAVLLDVPAGVDSCLPGVAKGGVTELGIDIAVEGSSDLVLAAFCASRGQKADQQADSEGDSNHVN
jgi:hypothetical protein